ncbi:uncharacterized protein NEPG_00841 [Nematocida parisii ERTm1]|uniref:Fe2OG dioxygenase domain-containing protein n=1 Tax=Nematocida parisii (strain ERTm3) TaxID=935791 RepID=I3EK77_NEMP3|nr:uncharacterized protein NEPG_00841 [Nematocida parisii ERTm1]EIJ89624.1 hypothetical protein NEQG_00394 [Nematocida parisii ERTm3]KAI5128650.1 alkylated DNA repair protein alkB-like protein 1 [Nematocida parisii]EIJ94174.1 hypothetical protein NEPG_00841 [Nematocida parisii ERTm1]KAI5128926.1 alkylated DNA repair protein alkB-like protein 1 [Nematocida parisii]KAI5141520.1 alkylated DNA repair protein alkB-like protein 1 [Nematocida parisii]|eukprot:XP_013058670.1 hypothetical protein NEPG_00841 [Nematocida parisii ERTm1]
MERTKLREVEKYHMHSEALPTINSKNAHTFCQSQEQITTNSKFLKDTVTAYYFKGGFIFIPNPLRKEVKREITKEVLTKLLYPPYRNSIDRSLEIEDLDIYGAYLQNKEISVKMYDSPVAKIKIKQNPYAPPEEKESFLNTGIVKISPIELIKKIRWSSIGIYYDWEIKAYNKEITSKIPDVIDQVCMDISQEICKVSFIPETAVINYYQKKDRIMSHIDRYEEDMSKPLISFSFGASCVFVLGTKEREDPSVDTFLLEDGDIAILIGDSREYFHGVPKILSLNKGLEDYKNEEFFSLISDSRINISVRQAYKYD